ncbi:tetratricopeptide repeat protein [Candidatus Margulisiibacteriota bacterium]
MAEIIKGPKEANALFQTARILYQKKEFNKALEKYLEACGIDEKLGDKRKGDLYYDYSEIASCYKKLKKTDLNKKYLRKALYTAISLESQLKIGKSWNKMGVFYYEQEKYKDAIRCFKKSIVHVIDTENEQMKKALTLAWDNYFNAAEMLGQTKEEASEWLLKLPYRQERLRLQALYFKKAIDYNQKKDYDRSFEFFLISAKISLELGEHGFVANRYLSAGLALLSKRDSEKASEYFNKALVMATENDRDDLTPVIYDAIGSVSKIIEDLKPSITSENKYSKDKISIPTGPSSN